MLNWGTVPEWFQTLIAALGLWGLYTYTRFTRDIRNSTLATQRAAVEPLLICSFVAVKEGLSVFEVQNEGQGIALEVRVAVILAPRHLGGFFDISEAAVTPLGDMTKGHRREFTTPSAEEALGETLIIEANDVNGDRHQLKLSTLATRLAPHGPKIMRQERASDRQPDPIQHKRKVSIEANKRNDTR